MPNYERLERGKPNATEFQDRLLKGKAMPGEITKALRGADGLLFIDSYMSLGLSLVRPDKRPYAQKLISDNARMMLEMELEQPPNEPTSTAEAISRLKGTGMAKTIKENTTNIKASVHYQQASPDEQRKFYKLGYYLCIDSPERFDDFYARGLIPAVVANIERLKATIALPDPREAQMKQKQFAAVDEALRPTTFWTPFISPIDSRVSPQELQQMVCLYGTLSDMVLPHTESEIDHQKPVITLQDAQPIDPRYIESTQDDIHTTILRAHYDTRQKIERQIAIEGMIPHNVFELIYTGGVINVLQDFIHRSEPVSLLLSQKEQLTPEIRNWHNTTKAIIDHYDQLTADDTAANQDAIGGIRQQMITHLISVPDNEHNPLKLSEVPRFTPHAILDRLGDVTSRTRNTPADTKDLFLAIWLDAYISPDTQVDTFVRPFQEWLVACVLFPERLDGETRKAIIALAENTGVKSFVKRVVAIGKRIITDNADTPFTKQLGEWMWFAQALDKEDVPADLIDRLKAGSIQQDFLPLVEQGLKKMVHMSRDAAGFMQKVTTVLAEQTTLKGDELPTTADIEQLQEALSPRFLTALAQDTGYYDENRQALWHLLLEADMKQLFVGNAEHVTYTIPLSEQARNLPPGNFDALGLDKMDLYFFGDVHNWQVAANIQFATMPKPIVALVKRDGTITLGLPPADNGSVAPERQGLEVLLKSLAVEGIRDALIRTPEATPKGPGSRRGRDIQQEETDTKHTTSTVRMPIPHTLATVTLSPAAITVDAPNIPGVRNIYTPQFVRSLQHAGGFMAANEQLLQAREQVQAATTPTERAAAQETLRLALQEQQQARSQMKNISAAKKETSPFGLLAVRDESRQEKERIIVETWVQQDIDRLPADQRMVLNVRMIASRGSGLLRLADSFVHIRRSELAQA